MIRRSSHAPSFLIWSTAIVSMVLLPLSSTYPLFCNAFLTPSYSNQVSIARTNVLPSPSRIFRATSTTRSLSPRSTRTFWSPSRFAAAAADIQTSKGAISEENELLEVIRSMKVKEIKLELESLSIPTKDAFEKEELVQRLLSARMNNVANGEQQCEDVPLSSSPLSSPSSSAWTVTAPLYYYELESSKSVAAQNANDIYLRPSPGKYAAIKVQLRRGGRSHSNDAPSGELTLLVDTACSGLVLTPEAIHRINRQCQSQLFQMVNSAGATMMTAGGAQGGYNVAKWDTYSTDMLLGGQVVKELNGLGMAAVQEIGALPTQLDGILGLSFLNQFACVDFDFTNKELRLHKTDTNPPAKPTTKSTINDSRDIDDGLSIVAQGTLSLTNLAIYTTRVTLDGKGPVRLLVDTGAASTFLNWKGVSDMNLSQSSPAIQRNREVMGAMGADNMALALTHRYVLQRRWNLAGSSSSSSSSSSDGSSSSTGEYFPGVGLRRGLRKMNTSGNGNNGSAIDSINVDIGDLPVLQALKGEGVGGILGADLLMMCDVVRFTGLSGGRSEPSVTLMME